MATGTKKEPACIDASRLNPNNRMPGDALEVETRAEAEAHVIQASGVATEVGFVPEVGIIRPDVACTKIHFEARRELINDACEGLGGEDPFATRGITEDGIVDMDINVRGTSTYTSIPCPISGEIRLILVVEGDGDNVDVDVGEIIAELVAEPSAFKEDG